MLLRWLKSQSLIFNEFVMNIKFLRDAIIPLITINVNDRDYLENIARWYFIAIELANYFKIGALSEKATRYKTR